MRLNDILRRPVRVAARLLVGAALLGGGAAGAGTLELLPKTIGLSEAAGPAEILGFGLGGFDPVSYQLDAAPRGGSPEHEATYLGLVWRFASRANKAAFERDPTAFLPRVGGFDAAAAAEGRLVWADPTIFAVVEGRLYLFRSEAERARFLDLGLAKAAETRWTDLARLTVKG